MFCVNTPWFIHLKFWLIYIYVTVIFKKKFKSLFICLLWSTNKIYSYFSHQLLFYSHIIFYRCIYIVCLWYDEENIKRYITSLSTLKQRWEITSFWPYENWCKILVPLICYLWNLLHSWYGAICLSLLWNNSKFMF